MAFITVSMTTRPIFLSPASSSSHMHLPLNVSSWMSSKHLQLNGYKPELWTPPCSKSASANSSPSQSATTSSSSDKKCQRHPRPLPFSHDTLADQQAGLCSSHEQNRPDLGCHTHPAKPWWGWLHATAAVTTQLLEQG